MSRSAALPGLAALLALTGCFQINAESCRLICTPEVGCPNDMTCGSQGLCVTPGVEMCAPLPNGDAGPPATLTHNGMSFTLPAAVAANMVLLLWPDYLDAPVGSPVTVWRDESGHRNDAQATYPTTAPPHVIADGVQLDPSQVGSGFEVVNSPSLDLGSGDFAVMVVAGLLAKVNPITLFSKSDSVVTNSRKTVIRYYPSSPSTGTPQGFVDDTQIFSGTDTTQPSVGVYGLRRVADHVDLRLNAGVLMGADLPAGASTTNSEDLYLGTADLETYTADSLEAVIILKGPVTDNDLNDLESYLTAVFRMPN